MRTGWEKGSMKGNRKRKRLTEKKKKDTQRGYGQIDDMTDDVPRRDMGDLKTMHDATMMTTLLRVLATEWVTGESLSRARKEASL